MTDITVHAVGVDARAQPGSPTLIDLSFEQVGSSYGLAAGWFWNRRVSFRFARFASITGWTRLEGFELGWGVDSFVGDLVAPTNAQALVFGTLGPTPGHFEHFEREWRMPAAPAPDSSHPGNETALFVWDAASPALFDTTLTFEAFEQQWHSNESYVWTFTSPELQAAVFGSSAFEAFETGWKSNGTYSFSMGSTAAAPFVEWVTTQTFEDFSAVAPDLPITFAPPNTINAPSVVLPTPAPLGGYPTNVEATFYNTGNVGALPPEIDSRVTYFIVIPLLGGGDSFEIASSAGGSPLSFTGGAGNNFFKSDPSRFWTLTDVGI